MKIVENDEYATSTMNLILKAINRTSDLPFHTNGSALLTYYTPHRHRNIPAK